MPAADPKTMADTISLVATRELASERPTLPLMGVPAEKDCAGVAGLGLAATMLGVGEGTATPDDAAGDEFALLDGDGAGAAFDAAGGAAEAAGELEGVAAALCEK
jgi:hypothetical protein